MKNINKAVAAGALGVALLAGTAGTFATWQNEAVQSAGTITTGDLSVTLNVAAGWNNNVAPQNNFRQNLSDYTFVPGMAVRGRFSGTVNAVGLTMDQVRLDKVIAGSEAFPVTEDGFVIVDDEVTNLRVTLGWSAFNRPGVTEGGNFVQDVIVEFVRDAEYGMYDNNLTAVAIDGITVTVTQR